MSAARHYEWPRLSQEDRMRAIHHRAAINLLLAAIKIGDPGLVTRAYYTVTAFLLRTSPKYTPLDTVEVLACLDIFESMPGGLPGSTGTELML